MIEILSYIKSRKWIILVAVILVLVVPYKLDSKEIQKHCQGEPQNATVAEIVALAYKYSSFSDCLGLGHFNIVAGNTNSFELRLTWFASWFADGGEYYAFDIWDYRIPNDLKLVYSYAWR